MLTSSNKDTMASMETVQIRTKILISLIKPFLPSSRQSVTNLVFLLQLLILTSHILVGISTTTRILSDIKPVVTNRLLQQEDHSIPPEDKQTLTLGKEHTFELTSVNAMQSIFELGLKDSHEHYLAISLTPTNYEMWIQVELSVYDESGNRIDSCSSQSIVVCIIPQNKLSQTSSIILKVVAHQAISLLFSATWQSVIDLPIDSAISVDFAFKKVAMLRVPATKDPTKEVKVTASPLSSRQHYVKMYMSTRQDFPNSEIHQQESVSLWDYGECMIINSQVLKQRDAHILVIPSSQQKFGIQSWSYNSINRKLNISKETNYEYLQAGKKHFYQLEKPKHQQLLILSITIWSGQIVPCLYMDSSLQSKAKVQFLSLSGISFSILNGSDFQQGLFLYFDSKGYVGSYSVRYYQFKYNSIMEPSSINFAFLKEKETDLFQLVLKPTQQLLAVTVNTISLEGEHEIQFRLCEDEETACLNPRAVQKVSQSISCSPASILGHRKSYRFYLSSFNPSEQKIIVVVKGTKGAKGNSVELAIQASIPSTLSFLKEKHPLEDTVQMDEANIYCFIIHDGSTVNQFRLHYNVLVGQIKLELYAQDPRDKSIAPIGQRQRGLASIQYPNKLRMVYIQVKGKTDHASYLLTVQIVRIDIEGGDKIGSISLNENIEFTIKIGPQQTQYIELNSDRKQLVLDYHSTELIQVCLLPNSLSTTCPDQRMVVKLEGKLNLTNLTSNRVSLMNTGISLPAVVNLLLHQSSSGECITKRHSVLSYDTFHNNSCILFTVPGKDKSIEIVFARLTVVPVSSFLEVCGQPFPLSSSFHSIELLPNDMAHCRGNKAQLKFRVTILGSEVLEFQGAVGVFLEDDTVQLLAGVSMRQIGESFIGKLRNYIYRPASSMNASVLVLRRVGSLTIFGKIVSEEKATTTRLSKLDYTFASVNRGTNPIYLEVFQRDFKAANCSQCVLIFIVYSQESDTHYDYDIQVELAESKLKEHEARSDFLKTAQIAYYSFEVPKTNPCELAVRLTPRTEVECANLYVSDSPFPSAENNLPTDYMTDQIIKCFEGTYYMSVEAITDCHYSISASTSKFRLTRLDQNVLVEIILEPEQFQFLTLTNYEASWFKVMSSTEYGSYAFYMKQVQEAQVYDYLTQESLALEKFQYSSESRKVIIARKEDPNYCVQCEYLIVVKAITHCKFRVFLAQQNIMVEVAPDRTLSDIVFSTFETQYYLPHVNAGKLNFHCFSGIVGAVLVYGQNRYNFSASQNEHIKPYEFDFSSQGLLISQSTDLIIIVSANGTDQASISFSIQRRAIMQDMVMELLLTVGEPIVTLVERGQDYCLRGFTSNLTSRITLTSLRKYSHILSEFNISLQLEPKPQRLSHSRINSSGRQLPNKLHLNNDDPINVSKSNYPSNHSSGQSPSDSLHQLTDVPIKTRIHKNTLYIEPTTQLTRNLVYRLCISWPHNQTAQAMENSEQYVSNMSLYVLQNSHVTTLIVDVEQEVRGESYFLVNRDKDFLLEVHDCVGRSIMLQSASYHKLTQLNESELKTNRSSDRHSIQGHVYTIHRKDEVTFLRVIAQHSIVRYLTIDNQLGLGLGYTIYGPGEMTYQESTDNRNNIIVRWKPIVKNMPESLTILKRVTYYVHAAITQKLVDEHVACQPLKAIRTVSVMNQPQLNSQLTVSISKKELRAIIQEQKGLNNRTQNNSKQTMFGIFLKVSAIAEIGFTHQQVSEQTQHYKLNYMPLQIPLQFILQPVSAWIPSIDQLIGIGLILLISVLLVYLISKILPYMSGKQLHQEQQQHVDGVMHGSSETNAPVADTEIRMIS